MASATWSYLGSIAIVTLFLLCLPILFTHALGVSLLVVLALAALAAIPASDAATALVNRAVVEMLPPRALPRLELADGVPPELKTLVVVPTLLLSPGQIAEQIARLGVHYLANADGELRFALLSDWTDSAQEHAPEDESLLAAARAGIARAQPATRPGQRWRGDDSRSFTAGASGARARGAGWAGSASAASCTSSIGCCAARPTPRSSVEPARRASVGDPLRHHARRRHAAAAGRRRAPGRHAGASR